MPDRYLKTDALILRTRPLGEADRLVTFLTRERGKMAAVARGARKMKSRLAYAVDLFTYGSYRFYLGRSLATLTGAEVTRQFRSLALDPGLYWHGQYLAGLADRFTGEGIPSPGVCRLLLTAWRLLEEERPPLELLLRAAELQLLHLAGYTPHLGGCLECGSPETAFFSAARGGTLCPACAGGAGRAMSRGTAALARRLLEAPLELAGKVRAGKRQVRELSGAVRSFLSYYLEMEIRTCPPFAPVAGAAASGFPAGPGSGRDESRREGEQVAEDELTHNPLPRRGQGAGCELTNNPRPPSGEGEG